MILTTQFLIFTFLYAIAVRSVVDVSFFSFRKTLSKVLTRHFSGGKPESNDPNISTFQIVMAFLADLVELVIVGYILFSTNLFVAVVLFSAVLANFLISWFAILCPKGYILKSEMARITWVYFALSFGIFKNVVCILSFLVYFILI